MRYTAGIVAWLKDKCNANEILVSLMLVYIAELFLSWAVQSPLRDPQGLGFPQSPMFEMAATLPIMIPVPECTGWGSRLLCLVRHLAHHVEDVYRFPGARFRHGA